MSFLFNNRIPKNINFNNYKVRTIMFNNKVAWHEELPKEYIPLNYIASTGTQYIDTELPGKPGYTIEAKISFSELSTGSYQYFAGYSYTGSSDRIYFIRINNSSNHLGYTYGSNVANKLLEVEENTFYNIKSTMKAGKQEFFVDGTRLGSSTYPALSYDAENPNSIYMFASQYIESINGNCKAKCQDVKWYDENNRLVRHYVPCYRNDDKKPGMYDLVMRKFYTNQGEGEFVKGYILPDEYQQIEYIQTTGTQYIDSGVPLKNGLKIIVDWIYADADSGNSYTGGHIGSPGNRWLIGSQRQKYYYFAVGTGNVPTEFEYGSRDVIEACWANKASYIKVNGIESTKYNYEMYALTEEPTYTYYMGAVNRTGSATLKPKLTIYSWKFYQDDVLIRDFVPCYRKSDNKIGLYDTVNNAFYTNNGTGTFEKGNNI